MAVIVAKTWTGRWFRGATWECRLVSPIWGSGEYCPARKHNYGNSMIYCGRPIGHEGHHTFFRNVITDTSGWQ